MNSNLLSQLKDIRYPDPISIWPLAIGWYGLIILCFIILFIITLIWMKYSKKHKLKKWVLKRIEELQFEQSTTKDVSEELSMLLKKAALASYPRCEVAGLFGEQWLKFLDKTAMTTEFTQGPGRLLSIYPYQEKNENLLPEQLFLVIRNWVKKNL